MRNETLFERLGIEYQEVEDIFYPLLSAETEDLSQPVGKYGDMWIGYLKERGNRLIPISNPFKKK